MTFLLIYLIGVLIALILIARETMKEFDIITLGNIAACLLFSLFSWILIIIEIGRYINWDRPIWKRKK